MGSMLTITDKDRGTNGVIGLIEDGEYHWFSIFDERDGLVKRFVDNIEDGTYLLEMTAGGKVVTVGPTDLDIVAVRYHFKPGTKTLDQGEVDQKYHDITGGGSIGLARRVGRWFDTKTAKITVKAGSTDPAHAHAVGIDYRVEGGSYARDSLILKFIPVD